jgi:hypothetical protein
VRFARGVQTELEVPPHAICYHLTARSRLCRRHPYADVRQSDVFWVRLTFSRIVFCRNSHFDFEFDSDSKRPAQNPATSRSTSGGANKEDDERDRRADCLNKFFHSLFKQKLDQLEITVYKPPAPSAVSAPPTESANERKRNDNNDLAQGFARRNVPSNTIKVPLKYA